MPDPDPALIAAALATPDDEEVGRILTGARIHRLALVEDDPEIPVAVADRAQEGAAAAEGQHQAPVTHCLPRRPTSAQAAERRSSAAAADGEQWPATQLRPPRSGCMFPFTRGMPPRESLRGSSRGRPFGRVRP